MKSIFFTFVIFVLVVLFYAAMGHHLYWHTDPWHFGTYIDSFVTFIQVSTFDNWTNIYYGVANGCLNWPGDYGSLTFTSDRIETAFGSFPLPVCTASAGQPVASAIIFITFAFVEGYILVSLNLAAVAIGINERLAELRDLSEYGELEDEEAQPPQQQEANMAAVRKAQGNSKAAKLLGNKKDKEAREIAAVLNSVWDLPQNGASVDQDAFSMSDFHSITVTVKLFVMSGWHERLYCVCIFIDAVLQFIDEDAPGLYDPDVLGGHWFFQSLFIIDAVLRVTCYYDNPKDLLKDNWAIFAIILTALNFVPLCHPSNNDLWYSIFTSFRILRLVAILKLFRFIPDLACILNAIEMSYLCMFYVAALMALFLSYFAIAGLLLFKSALPYFFSSIGSSMWSLVQCMTQDNWSSMMRMAEYGCENYGFKTNVTGFDKTCITDGNRGHGVGYWSPIFFVIFVVVASMVLVSLLVGVIITSLELDREDLLEEEVVKAKLRVVQRRYHLHTAQVTKLMHLFEKCDNNQDGALTYEELVVILDSIKMDPTEQFQFFLRVDQDKSGQIDFAEFCEMIALVGLSRRANVVRQPMADKGRTTKAGDKAAGMTSKIPVPDLPVEKLQMDKLQMEKVENSPEHISTGRSVHLSAKAEAAAHLVVKGFETMVHAIDFMANELIRDTKEDEDTVHSYHSRGGHSRLQSLKLTTPRLSTRMGPISAARASSRANAARMSARTATNLTGFTKIATVVPLKEEEETGEIKSPENDRVRTPVKQAYQMVPTDMVVFPSEFDVRQFGDDAVEHSNSPSQKSHSHNVNTHSGHRAINSDQHAAHSTHHAHIGALAHAHRHAHQHRSRSRVFVADGQQSSNNLHDGDSISLSHGPSMV
jgi:hypothetical protein